MVEWQHAVQHGLINKGGLLGLTRLEEEDGDLAEVKVDKVLGLVGDVGAEVAADDHVPRRVVPGWVGVGGGGWQGRDRVRVVKFEPRASGTSVNQRGQGGGPPAGRARAARPATWDGLPGRTHCPPPGAGEAAAGAGSGRAVLDARLFGLGGGLTFCQTPS